jgi:hypothetical protein
MIDLNLLTLCTRHRYSDALFSINVFSDAKYCPSVPESVGIRVLIRKIYNFITFH